jgi:hypothetical protein
LPHYILIVELFIVFCFGGLRTFLLHKKKD